MKHFPNHSLALTPTGTNQPASVQLRLPKYGDHIQIACWDWPLADAKSAWVLPGGLLAGSSQNQAQVCSSDSGDDQVPVSGSAEVNI